MKKMFLMACTVAFFAVAVNAQDTKTKTCTKAEKSCCAKDAKTADAKKSCCAKDSKTADAKKECCSKKADAKTADAKGAKTCPNSAKSADDDNKDKK